MDGREYEMNPAQNLLHACLSLGFDLPYFCWHPAMGSVGACRQCAVKQFKNAQDKQGKIVMACMTPVSEGALISIRDPEAVKFRAAVIEGLMLNHPHDCPVCDEGGECHLQDMTVMTGHDYRRYRFNKRTFRNQDLGPLVNHEMNRCIQCYRCERFYREYAGGRDFHSFVLRDLVFFGRHEDGTLESEFAGNLVEVCPTGVFTDKTLKHHYTRKWDLRMAPSVCVHCSVGCNISAGERYGMLRRVVNRYNGEVNGYFLCDRGRYGYEFVNSDRRIRRASMQGREITPDEARAQLTAMAAAGAIGIGSPRASLESNVALRELVGPEQFFAGMPDSQLKLARLIIDTLRTSPARSPSLRDIEHSDAVLVLGEDLINVAPMMGLSVRQSTRQQPFKTAEKLNIPLWMDHAVRTAVQDEKGPLFIATVNVTKLDDAAVETYRAAPDDIARLGFAVAHAIDETAPAVPDLTDDSAARAARIAEALVAAERPLVIAGPSCGSEAIVHAAANIARALHSKTQRLPGLAYTMPECNAFGLALLTDRSLDAAFDYVHNRDVTGIIVLENDLYRAAAPDTIDQLLSGRRVAVLDHVLTPTAQRADVVVPAATYAESDGTLINYEGRAQRFYQVFVPDGDILESWRWLAPDAWANLDDAVGAAAAAEPLLSAVASVSPPSEFRIAGSKIPRAPHRYSGRTAILANIDVSEPKPPQDPDTPLSFTMEGSPRQPPSPLIPFFWSPGWNSIQATNKYQSEIAGALRGGDPGVRLIEPAPEPEGSYNTEIPAAFVPLQGEWLLLQLPHAFGSEELSLLAPGIAQLTPAPYIALNDADLPAAGLRPGEEVLVAGVRLHIKVAREMPRGVAGLFGAVLGLPAWSRIERIQ